MTEDGGSPNTENTENTESIITDGASVQAAADGIGESAQASVLAASAPAADGTSGDSETGDYATCDSAPATDGSSGDSETADYATCDSAPVAVDTTGDSETADYATCDSAPAADGTIGVVSFQPPGDFLATFQEMSRDWMACATAEVELGFKYSRRLMAARTIPDAVGAYGEWVNEEMGARAADASRLMSHGQKLMDCSSRLLCNGWARPDATL